MGAAVYERYFNPAASAAKNTLQEIERAIQALTPREVEELYTSLDQHCPQPIDTRVESGLSAGRLDSAISRALDDEKNGRVQPL
jgi:hypothetical protein